MIAYTTIGVTDFPRAAKFYEALAQELGASRMMGSETENLIVWVGANGEPGIGILHPDDGKPATVGNGMMVALAAKNTDQVDRLHEIALANGGTCEGQPGPRIDGQYFAGYFRDPDGNKLNAFIVLD